MSDDAKKKDPKAPHDKGWLGPKRGYTDMLDDALDAQGAKEKEGKRAYNPLRPSSAGKCARKLAYELAEYRLGWKYEVEPLKARTLRIFRLGHAIEYETIKDFRKIPGFQVKYCQQVVDSFVIERGSPELPTQKLEGSVDWVLWSDEHKVVMDAKSRRDKFFGQYMTEWKAETSKLKKFESTQVISATAIWIDNLDAFLAELEPGDTLADNLYQLNIYACSDFCTSRGIDHAVILRYNKNTSEEFEIRFRPSLTVLAVTHEKFNRISIAVDAEKLEDVAQEFQLGSFACAFCDYAKFCRPGVDTKQAFFNANKRK